MADCFISASSSRGRSLSSSRPGVQIDFMLIRLLLNGILDFFVKVNVGADDAVHLVV